MSQHPDGLVPWTDGGIPTDPHAHEDTDEIGYAAIGPDDDTEDAFDGRPTLPASDAETEPTRWQQREFFPAPARLVLAKKALACRAVGMRWREVGDELGVSPRVAVLIATEYETGVMGGNEGGTRIPARRA